MGGGLIQLVAYGAQDVYLTGNPQITYFKVVYRRHTNFSMECIEHPIDSAKFGGRHTVQILRNGDLATRLYLRFDLPALTVDDFVVDGSGVEAFCTKAAWVRRVGHALVKNVEITIGGSQIDKHWATWMDLWYELTHTEEQERGYNKMVGDVPELTELRTGRAAEATGVPSANVINGYTLYVPLQFWFCRNTGLALPLIALQYHEVRLNIELEQLSNLLVVNELGWASGATPSVVLGSCGLMVDYIYLDSEERRRFAQVGHEYLIEQLQFNGEESISSSNVKHKLEFNHPSKELVFATKVGAWTAGESFLTYTGSQSESAWADALEAAANNVAAGMFCLANAKPTGTWVEVELPAVAANSSQYVKPTNGNQYSSLDITVLVNTANGVTAGDNVLYVNVDALETTTGAAISAKIRSVLVTISEGAADSWLQITTTGGVYEVEYAALTGVSVCLPPGAVQVVSHDLTLADVSVPLSSCTDERSTTANQVNFDDVTVLQPFNYGLQLDGQGNIVMNAQLKLNGHDRFSVQDGPYFNYVQPAQHHTRTPADGVNVYSFALHPEQHQPSGSANLSRIDTTLLAVTYSDNLRNPNATSAVTTGPLDLFTNTNVYIFDFSYNVLRVMSGMAGVAYAN